MAEHADTALKFGRFRIGTLQEYRSSEYGKGIQDGQEGIKQYVPLLENIKDLTPEQFSAQYPQLAQVMREQGRFESSMQNIKEGIPVALEYKLQIAMYFA